MLNIFFVSPDSISFWAYWCIAIVNWYGLFWNLLKIDLYTEFCLACSITTLTKESVRRAIAIQLIINQEFGLTKNQNPNQGSFIIEELTELVEEAVLTEFENISERGGVLGAMETNYQRDTIQKEYVVFNF